MNHFKVTPRPHGLSIEMTVSLDLVDRAVDHVKALCLEKGLREKLFATTITMREGLTNAMRHGSAMSPDATVRFAIFLSPKMIHMEFEDTGPGFDWKKTLGKATPTHAEGGRGMKIIRRYCHSMSYSKNGRLLQVAIQAHTTKDE